MLSLLESKEKEEPMEFCAVRDGRYGRSQRDDLHIALELLYDFKDKLSELHPSILPIVQGILKAQI